MDAKFVHETLVYLQEEINASPVARMLVIYYAITSTSFVILGTLAKLGAF